jgi:hypothetical protein
VIVLRSMAAAVEEPLFVRSRLRVNWGLVPTIVSIFPVSAGCALRISLAPARRPRHHTADAIRLKDGLFATANLLRRFLFDAGIHLRRIPFVGHSPFMRQTMGFLDNRIGANEWEK